MADFGNGEPLVDHIANGLFVLGHLGCFCRGRIWQSSLGFPCRARDRPCAGGRLDLHRQHYQVTTLIEILAAIASNIESVRQLACTTKDWCPVCRCELLFVHAGDSLVREGPRYQSRMLRRPRAPSSSRPPLKWGLL